jgi:hypothetical protein
MKGSIGFITILFFLLFFLFTAKSVLAAEVVINEFVIDGSPEWVEFYNASSSADYLKEYYIDDDEDFNSDSGSRNKKSLENLNTSNISHPYLDLDSSSPMFNNDSDSVVLFDKDGNIVDSYSYDKNPGSNISIGRSPDRSGDFFVLSSLTKGAANSSPIPTTTPTPTSTLTPTPNPTNTPTPTTTPAPTITPTPTKTLTSIPIPSVVATKSSSVSAKTQDVLGANEEKGEFFLPTNAEQSNKDSLNSNENGNTGNNWFQKISIFIGIVFIVSCAILTFRILKKGEIVKND